MEGMEYRPLEIKVISAKDLKDVHHFSKMNVYVLAEIAGGDIRIKQKTPVNRDSGTNPRWNYLMKFTFKEDALQQNKLTIIFKLKSEGTFGEKDVGQVYVPIKELFYANHEEKELSFSVWNPSGKVGKGTINLIYKFGEKFGSKNSERVDHGPAIPFPVTGAATSSAYPPPQGGYYPPPPQGVGVPHPLPHGFNYPRPTQAGYGVYPPPHGVAPGHVYPPPQQAGYGYAQPMVQRPEKKKNKFGLGMGLGAGLLGGLLVGDMVSDVGEMAAYDAGFYDGFDDAGFDF